ncbi:MAG: response regulator [Chloroflexota bacterium]
MAEPKQILVIDDHFEMLEFLRSMLEVSNQDYRVLGVPSAEEGLFELRRTSFDLVISDVRLPGMSGFDLVRQMQKLERNLPVIIITAYATAQGRQEAEALGVVRYFEKPLDTDTLLATVHTTLYGSESAPPPAVEMPDAGTSVAAAKSEAQGDRRPVRKRLQTLLTDTGAAQILVADREGAIVAQVGEQRNVDLELLARLVAKNLDNSFLLGEQLQSREPFAIQYQAGESVDLYFANIERAHFIMLLFDVQERRGRIGTVWIFTQRAIKDLKSLLPVGPGDGEQNVLPTQETEATSGAETIAASGEAAEGAPEAPATPEATAERTPSAQLPSAEAPLDSSVDQAESAGAPAAETDEEEDGGEQTPPAEDPALASALDEGGLHEDLDLDAFWEEAASDMEPGTEGLSFEEAMRRGLLPPEFGEDEQG